MAVKNLVRVNTYMDPGKVKELDEIAKAKNVSRAELIRELIELGVKWGGYYTNK